MEKLKLKNKLNRVIERMPEPLVREILDFAEFLLGKKGIEVPDPSAETNSTSRRQTKHLEEEFLNYKLAYPKQKNELFVRTYYLYLRYRSSGVMD